MTLTRWIPRKLFGRGQRRPTEPAAAPLAQAQRDMNRNTSLGRWAVGIGAELFRPVVDVIEHRDNIIVKAELPGLGKDDVSVTLQDHCLVLRGEKKRQSERNDAGYYLRESSYGAFKRVIGLPGYIDARKADARFKDGVLQITLPKTEEARSRFVEVQVR
jgi:HSP20 family protein